MPLIWAGASATSVSRSARACSCAAASAWTCGSRDGTVSRLQQEDFCQALGLRSTLKYEAEGDPDFARCFGVVVDHSAEPALDMVLLLRWLAFNAIVGGADRHAKNLCLMRVADRRLRLAPFCDLIHRLW